MSALRITQRIFLPLLLICAFTTSNYAQSSPPAIAPAPADKHIATPEAGFTPAEPPEDWNVLSIQGLALDPRPVFLVQHDVKKDYTRDLVRVQWRTGDSIELFVFTPNGMKKAPAILYLYSYPSSTDRFYDESWAERATSDGYAAVGFVSALTGQRYHTRPMKEWFVSELQESLATSTHDVQMMLNYLATRGDIDMARIGMFGQGSGGTIAILAAAADPRIKALDLLDPWGDWPDWLRDSPQVPEDERADYLKPLFLSKLKDLDPVHYLPHLGTRSLRIQEIDSLVPKAAMEKLAASVPAPGDVLRYKDPAAHYAALHRMGVSGWLKEQLQPPTLPGAPQTATAGTRSQIPLQPH